MHPSRGSAGRLPCALRVCGPLTRTHVETPWSVFQDGPNRRPRADATDAGAESTPRRRALRSTIERRRLHGHDYGRAWAAARTASVHARVDRRTGSSPFHIRPGRIAGPIRFPPEQFQALFDSLFKVLFIFPSRYLFAYRSLAVFSLGRNLPPDWGCIPKQPELAKRAPRGATGSGHDGALTLSGAPFRGTWARSAG